jgi:beta-glucosidase-like glycosyl hydrolase
VAELVRELQGVARDAAHSLPLLVGVDQEGGRVARLKEPWTVWPPMRAVGRIGSEDIARQVGAALAAELSACGIRYDFAPDVDVDTNPKNPIIGDRSFGDDPRLVGRLGAAMIRGLQDAGVAACAKHFPGHGDTDVDSHLDLPAVDHERSRLDEIELVPFRKAIEAGVATIMTAHVLVRSLDEEVPATLSPRVIDGLLRREMKYGGLIVSDDLEMKAVADHWGAAAGRGEGRAGRLRPPARLHHHRGPGRGHREPGPRRRVRDGVPHVDGRRVRADPPAEREVSAALPGSRSARRPRRGGGGGAPVARDPGTRGHDGLRKTP